MGGAKGKATQKFSRLCCLQSKGHLSMCQLSQPLHGGGGGIKKKLFL